MLWVSIRVADQGRHALDLHYRPQKQKRTEKPKLLEAYLTDEMKKRIDECEWLSKKGPFWYGAGTDPTPLAQAVYERMQTIGARAGIADCRPHRLRDTFAVRRTASRECSLKTFRGFLATPASRSPRHIMRNGWLPESVVSSG